MATLSLPRHPAPAAAAPSHARIRAQRFLRALVKALQTSARLRVARELEAMALRHAHTNRSYADDLVTAAQSLRNGDV
jgi:hypothetical protein